MTRAAIDVDAYAQGVLDGDVTALARAIASGPRSS
jgi:hypothetical protein